MKCPELLLSASNDCKILGVVAKAGKVFKEESISL